jgi:diadenosine tetraphosphate (Ap4A) HIT family hydrolase
VGKELECRFCNKILNKNHQEIEDTILYENEYFICVPALGCFVTGYTLLISKRHINSIGGFTAQEKLSFQDIVESVLSRQLYQAGYLLFEHGSSSNRSKTSSCISHFHFHLLPWIEPKIKELLLEVNDPLTICDEYDDWFIYNEYRSDKEYLMLSDGFKTYFYCADSLQSQYIRKVISNRMNLENKWNWAIFPFYEKIIKTIRQF